MPTAILASDDSCGCACAVTSNDTLAGLGARDGITPTEGQIVGCFGQTDATASGPYVAHSGTWDRVIGLTSGQIFTVAGGTANGGRIFVLTTPSINPASFNAASGACATNLSFSGGSLNPGPGSFTTVTASGALTAASVTATGTVTAQGSGVQVLVATPTAAAGAAIISADLSNGSATPRGIRIAGDTGTALTLTNASSPSVTLATSRVQIDTLCISLANNATFDYTLPLGGALGGIITIMAPANSAASIGGSLYFGSDASTSLGGLAPTNITATLTTANKINVGASSGKLRIENKLGSTQTIIAIITVGASL